jgi:hypothetical protein
MNVKFHAILKLKHKFKLKLKLFLKKKSYKNLKAKFLTYTLYTKD